MSKKHFIQLADTLRMLQRNADDGGRVPMSDVLSAMVHFCRDTNPRFNEERFRAYIAGECGPNGGRVKRAA